MQDFFIRSFEVLVGVIVVVLTLGVLVAAAGTAFGGGGPMMPGAPMARGGMFGLFVLIAGGAYVVFVGGILYLGIGIYRNTRRTAEAMERLADRP